MEIAAAGRDDGTYYTTKCDEVTIHQRDLKDNEEASVEEEISDVSDNDFEESEEEGKMITSMTTFHFSQSV